QPLASCGTTGVCNGMGACRLYAASQVCDSTPSCDSNSNAVILSRVCNGTGACVSGTTQACTGSPVCSSRAYVATCTDDGMCAASKFCSASICSGNVNLAGNGDLETGTNTGWQPFAGGSLGLSSPASSGYSHGGQYSVMVSGRSQSYRGPSYNLPT